MIDTQFFFLRMITCSSTRYLLEIEVIKSFTVIINHCGIHAVKKKKQRKAVLSLEIGYLQLKIGFFQRSAIYYWEAGPIFLLLSFKLTSHPGKKTHS